MVRFRFTRHDSLILSQDSERFQTDAAFEEKMRREELLRRQQEKITTMRYDRLGCPQSAQPDAPRVCVGKRR
jgi:hypothetical protein